MTCRAIFIVVSFSILMWFGDVAAKPSSDMPLTNSSVQEEIVLGVRDKIDVWGLLHMTI